MTPEQIRMHDKIERPQGSGDFRTADAAAQLGAAAAGRQPEWISET